MKALSLPALALAAASAQAGDALSYSLPTEPTRLNALASNGAAMRLQDAGEKKAQIWVGIGSLSYERFSGVDAGDEFGFTPTGYLGYQRNFYPGGRLTNGIGYSLGVGVAALGAAVFYHQGSSRRVDFRAGIAADFVYFNNFSYFGGSNFVLVPFIAWGIKI